MFESDSNSDPDNLNYPVPSDTGYTIFSKSGCHFCIEAKTALKQYNPEIINCDKYLALNRTGFLTHIKEQTGQDYKTFPMIFHNAKFIGGYTDLIKYMANIGNNSVDSKGTRNDTGNTVELITDDF